MCSWLDSGVCDVLVDAANACARSLSDLDVALVSPCGAPGISDEVVSTSGGIGAVTNGSDGVVDVRAASSAGDNTTSVRLENGGVGLDGN